MKYAKLSLFALAAVLAFPVFADGIVDDVVKLANGNASEDVIVAWVERSHNTVSLSVEDILKLKDAKVPDRAIAALIRSGAMANGGRIMARDEGGRMVDRETQPMPPPQQQVIPASQTSQVNYVESQPSTTYVTPQYSYVYSDSYPVYYGGYYWPRSYYGGGYYGYGYGYPGFGLSLNFGHGGYYGGYGHGYYGGYGHGSYGGYGHGSYGGGFSGGYSSGGHGSFGGGYSGGYSGGHSSFGGGSHGGFSGGGSHGHR